MGPPPGVDKNESKYRRAIARVRGSESARSEAAHVAASQVEAAEDKAPVLRDVSDETFFILFRGCKFTMLILRQVVH